MKVLVAGSRKFNDYERLKKVLDEIEDIDEIVSGEANGADALGSKYGLENNIHVQSFIPNWEGLGNRAGYERNLDMANYLDRNKDMAVIFWDGSSRGSKHMIDICEKMGIKHEIHLFEIPKCKHEETDIDLFGITFCTKCGDEV